MKFKYIPMLFLAASLGLASCDDYLDKEPESNVTPAAFFTSEADLAAYTINMYGVLTSNNPGSSCFCGLRFSDIKGLKWESIFCDSGQYRLQVVMQKTKAPIYLPLSSEALKWLPMRNGKGADEKVFSLPSNARVNDLIKPWAEAAGITKHFTFHTARHTFATMMLTLGADLYTTSKLLGHTDVRMTQVYAKIVNKKKDEAVNLVNGLFD